MEMERRGHPNSYLKGVDDMIKNTLEFMPNAPFGLSMPRLWRKFEGIEKGQMQLVTPHAIRTMIHEIRPNNVGEGSFTIL